MRRTLFSLFLAASCLHATSYTFTFCAAGSTTLSPCNSNLALDSGGLVGPDYVVRAYAAVPSPLSGALISALATGVTDNPSGSISLFGIAGAGDSMTYQSQGPPRAGFIQFDVSLLYPHEDFQGAATAMLTDGVNDYSFIGGGGINGPIAPIDCAPEDCLYVGRLPFQLGSQFAASASVLAFANTQSGSSQSGVNFSLLEADGTTPVAFFATPEPFPGGLQIVGLSLIGCALWKRRSASKRKASALRPTQP
jgi:hypothetical protein